MEDQLERTYANFSAKDGPIEKNIFLAGLQDRNETLFYRLVLEHIAEMLPIIYTPTVGEACRRYSRVFRRARGLYLSYPQRDRMRELLKNVPYDDIEVIVATDGERILGLGDLGLGGMGIPVGKLSIYTLGAGIHPRKTLPVLLDVGTNNPELLNDPLYLGWQNERLRGSEYDSFIDLFIRSVRERWPKALVQWEDFAKANAWRLLERYRNDFLSFNDDIQGTASVTLAGILRALHIEGRGLSQERIVYAGAGSAATGTAQLIALELKKRGVSQETAKAGEWLVDSVGLVHQGRSDLSSEKKLFAQTVERVKSLGMNASQAISLEEVVAKVKPTILIGASGQPGTFSESLVKEMARHAEKPIIFPLSNPTSKAEAAPEDIFKWTGGNAWVATGSPFGSVSVNGKKVAIGQCNNAFIFPGVGLGIVASGAKKVPEEFFLASAKALSDFDKRLAGFEDSLFPNLESLREISEKIAVAVVLEAIRLGLAEPSVTPENAADLVSSRIWQPVYPKLKRLGTVKK
jgi:malate dehydrogenase (oxaloacetate-decarboxylating)